MILGVTGHRSNKLGGFSIPNPIYNYVFDETEKILLDLKPEKIITGMALGFDILVAHLCVKLGIPFIAAVPHIGQENIWNESSKQVYHKLLEKAAQIVIVSPGGYAAYKMQIRNKWIVENSGDKILACWDGSSGGSSNCISFARSVGKEIIVIDPRKHETA